jgi:hypothetical protein
MASKSWIATVNVPSMSKIQWCREERFIVDEKWFAQKPIQRVESSIPAFSEDLKKFLTDPPSATNFEHAHPVFITKSILLDDCDGPKGSRTPETSRRTASVETARVLKGEAWTV